MPLFRLRFLPHAGPDIGVDDISIGDRLAGVFGAEYPGAGADGIALRQIERFIINSVAGRGGNTEIHAGQRGRQHQAAGYVVAIADEGQSETAQVPFLLADGKQVGQRLAGVFAVGEGVYHRHAGISCQSLQGLLRKGAGGDGIHIAAEHAGHIGNRFPLSQTDFGRGEIDRLAAQLAHGHLKADAGTQRGLFKHYRQRLATEQRRPALRLHINSVREQQADVLNTEVSY